ncbi:di/tricarboxylate transporter [Rhodovulum bhavnagarense]|uniref:Di/tricarboxylate transporter n=1 Tax=Rhodovulum bhavnagarense TaxID=992286 RepID=A0A4R2R947_9RHOB|nr:SLC13 family permease [Rhodovulum bhavnagarense]TCP59740.1 di/tricarboxylate transporter [Rhodovulum bhavnagarense]
MLPDSLLPLPTDLALVVAILIAAVTMFAVNRPRMDVVAVMVIVALPLTGVISISEALAGFSDSNVILIAALFVVGEALVQTGVTQRIGDWVAARAGRSEARLIFLLMVGAAALSSIMSSTGVVAIFIPMVLRIARSAQIAPGRLMMPLSMAALISGMLTLIGTPPNLIVHGELVRRGEEGFGFFDFTPFGLPILVLAILYMIALRRFIGGAAVIPPDPARRSLGDWVDEFDLAHRVARLRVAPGARATGQPLSALELDAPDRPAVLAIERNGSRNADIIQPHPDTVLRAGDVLMIDVAGQEGTPDASLNCWGLVPLGLSGGWFTERAREMGLAQAMVPPNSPLAGQSVAGARFPARHDLSVIGLRHGARPVPGALRDELLRPGDTLLLMGTWPDIHRLRDRRGEVVMLDLPGEADDVAPRARRAPQALLVVGLMILGMVIGVAPNVHLVLLACLALGLFGCVTMTGAYGAMHMKSLVLIVGMLPFALALERTGGVDMAAAGLIALAGEASPRVLLAAIFLTTSLFSLFISNTATAVLMAPVAMAVADSLGISPYPFAMTVALAASAAFMTPVSSPVNTLVLGPGGYRFVDFVRIGLPFSAITLAVVIAMVPVILPF